MVNVSYCFNTFAMLCGQIFEVGDVVALDTSRDVGASNNRRLAALYCNSNSGFEVIHMTILRK
jgi:phenylalanyl-tRNA synthetase beta chain